MKHVWVVTEKDENGDTVSQKFFHKLENALREAEMIAEFIVKNYNEANDDDIAIPPLIRKREGTYFVYLIGSYASAVEIEMAQYSDE